MQKAPFTARAGRDRAHRAALRGLRLGRAARASRCSHEYDENRHWTRTFIVERRRPAGEAAPALGPVERRALQGPRLARVSRSCRTAQWVVRQDGDAIFLARRRARRPTAIGRSSIASTSKTQQDRAPVPQRQDRARVVPRVHRRRRARTFLTWHQSPTDPPNAFLRTLGARGRRRAGRRGGVRVDAARRSRTSPIRRPRCARSRSASSSTSARTASTCRSRSTRRPDYKEGTRVPAILYAYPLDYADADEGRPGHRLGADVHAPPRTTGCCCSPATRSSTTRRSRSSAIRRRPTTRTSSSSSPTRRPRSTRPSSSASSIRDRIGVTGHSHGALMTVNLARALAICSAPASRRAARTTRRSRRSASRTSAARCGRRRTSTSRSRRSSSPTRSSCRS